MAMKTAAQNPAKNVRVFRNGDFNYSGRKFVVNDRYARNFDAFLTQVTAGLRAQFGAVRNLYTPSHGTRVRKLEQLTSGGEYVAGGTERFKASTVVRARGKMRQIGYRDITSDRVGHREESKGPKRPIVVVSARLHKFDKTPTMIHVFRNGDELFKGIKFVLSKRDFHNWDQLMTLIGDKIQLRTGAVRKLCTLDGQAVSQVTNGGQYVAVGSDKFKKLSYSTEGLVVIGPSPKKVTQTSQRQVVVHHLSKQSTVTRLSVERKMETVKEESPRAKKSTVRRKPKQIKKTEERQKPDQPTSQLALQVTPVPVMELEPVRDVTSSVSSLKSSHSKDNTSEIFHGSSSGVSVDRNKPAQNLPARDIQDEDVFNASDRSEHKAEVVTESNDIEIEKTVDMLEAHEVDDKQADEERNENQEAVHAVGSATSSQQRPASWSGGSQKLRQSRPTSGVSSRQGNEEVAKTISEVPEHGDISTNQQDDSADVPDDSEMTAVPDSIANDAPPSASELPDVDNLDQQDNVGSTGEVPNVANVNDEERMSEHESNNSPAGERRETGMETPAADA